MPRSLLAAWNFLRFVTERLNELDGNRKLRPPIRAFAPSTLLVKVADVVDRRHEAFWLCLQNDKDEYWEEVIGASGTTAHLNKRHDTPAASSNTFELVPGCLVKNEPVELLLGASPRRFALATRLACERLTEAQSRDYTKTVHKQGRCDDDVDLGDA
jgi:hypothetical protein